VPPPKDPQYEASSMPLNQPLIHENRGDHNDVKHYYNPDKKATLQQYEHVKSLSEITPEKRDGVVAEPKDPQFKDP
jgi:hypothetical protein